MLKEKGLVLQFFQLKLKIPLNLALNCIKESSRITKILLKKSLELGLELEFYLILIFMLILAGINLYTKKKCGK